MMNTDIFVEIFIRNGFILFQEFALFTTSDIKNMWKLKFSYIAFAHLRDFNLLDTARRNSKERLDLQTYSIAHLVVPWLRGVTEDKAVMTKWHTLISTRYYFCSSEKKLLAFRILGNDTT